MANFSQTYRSGNREEKKLQSMLENYTYGVWRNVRIDTLLTAKGNTEIDLVCCLRDRVLLIESKNVSLVRGKYNDRKWGFIGSTSSSNIVGSTEYKALNTMVQNNIHVKSFKDMYYQRFGTFPIVESCIVVPPTCRVEGDIAGELINPKDLREHVIKMQQQPEDTSLAYSLSSLLSDNCHIKRIGFKEDRATKLVINALKY